MHCCSVRCSVHCSLFLVRLAWTVPLMRWPNPDLSCLPTFRRPAVAGVMPLSFVKSCSLQLEEHPGTFSIMLSHCSNDCSAACLNQ